MADPSVLWPVEHELALRALVAEGAGSHAVMAGILNERFGTAYSRNAVIGKSGRMGLSVKCAKVVKAIREPRVRSRPAPTPKPKPSEDQIARFRCTEVVPKHVAIIDLSKDGCRWPYGDGSDSDPYSFCDHPQFLGSSYCGPHFALSIGAGTHSEREAA